MANEVKTLARGSITIIDYNDAASISSLIESNKPLTVIYTNAARSSEWTESLPLILNPVVFVSSTGGSAENQAKNLKNMQWFYQRSGGSSDAWTEITVEDGKCTDTRFTIPQSGDVKNRLEVRCDGKTGVAPLLDDAHSTVSFKYSGDYEDGNGMITKVGGAITFSMIKSGTDKAVSVLYTPDGNVFMKSPAGDTPDKTAVIEMWKGSVVDFADVDFRWYLQKDGIFNPMVLQSSTQVNGDTMTFTAESWDPTIEVGSQFSLEDTTHTWNPENPTLQSTIYKVTEVNAANHQIKVCQLNDGTKKIDGAYSAGTHAVSRWWDARTGRGWARITATSPAEAVTEGLATDGTTGVYLGELNTTNISDGSTTHNCTGSNVLVVPAAAVYGIETFKGVAYDLDPVMNGGLAYLAHPQVINFLDYTDPYQITLISANGNIIRNGVGFVKIETEIRQGGELLAGAAKSNLYYDWSLYNNAGEQVQKFTHGNKNDNQAIRGYGRDTYEVATPIVGTDGATLEVTPKFDTCYLSKADIVGKGTATCEISIR